MKKRILAVAMVAVFAMFAVSCGADGNAQSGQDAEEKVFTEGEDTACEVTYRSYEGEHGDLFLKEGDKIAVITPSALPEREQVDAVMNGLKDWGYEPVEGKYVCVETRTLDQVREDLEWALEDPEIRAVFCVRGGYGASEVADVLSPDIVRNANKLIIGYSDISVYHSTWTANGVPSIHACMSGTFDGLPESCFEAEENILKGEIPSYTCESNAFCRQGEAEGVLIGGNLSTLTSVLGTDYDCTKNGQPYILFLEEINENFQHIHRYLTVLEHAGVLDNAAGIVFGEWTGIPEDMGDCSGSSRGGTFGSVAEMISKQFLADSGVPVAFGLPAGHGDINYPLLMGENAKLTVDAEHFTLVCGSSKLA